MTTAEQLDAALAILAFHEIDDHPAVRLTGADFAAVLATVRIAINSHAALVDACRVMAMISDAYHANELDDEARKLWGQNNEFRNQRNPAGIILYAGRGGKTLLTLADCFAASAALAAAQPQEAATGPT